MVRIGCFNANGLVGKAEPILEFIHSNKLNLFFITETLLDDNESTPIRGCFMNLAKPRNNGVITGGRRNTGGIIGMCSEEIKIYMSQCKLCSGIG
jgi:hypothetical protein